MCQCDPKVRTPFCGQPGCEWPETSKGRVLTDAEIDRLIVERDGWKRRCLAEIELQVKYREMWERAEAECQKERQRRVADQEACLRMGNQLCDWQTRAIEAERKLKER